MKIIISLETKESLDIIPYLGKYIDGVKINHLLWNELDFDVQKDKELFVDFKLWDTPNTVKTVVESIIKKGGTMTTISTFNNESVFDELVQYKDDIKLLAVTYLTSWNPEEQRQIAKDMPYNMWHDHIARIRHKGFRGIICSPLDIVQIKHEDFMHDLYRVCPGITYGNKTSGQVRTTTPKEAQDLGADYIVVGRAITESSNPVETAMKLKEEICSVEMK